jgi:lysophospholipase L1-like esterase
MNRRLNRLRLKWPLFVLCAGWLATPATPAQTNSRWVGTWAASQQLVEWSNSLPPATLRDGTLRQIVHISIGGAQLRVRLSNRFGAEPLRIDSVQIARSADPASAKIVAGTDKTVTFSGRRDVTIPAGAEYASDPIAMVASALSNLAITLHMEDQPTEQTGHPGSRATSYVVPGDHVSDEDLQNPLKIEHWYFVAGVDVPAPGSDVVVLGDSITDGHGATTNGNDRWPDVLAQRLNADPVAHTVGVLNEGIGGNRILLDGLGPNAMSRFNDDVIAQPGARYVIVLEGVNDIGGLARLHEVSKAEHDEIVRRIESAYQQMVARAHDHGIIAIGATILPFTGSDYYHPSPATEADRVAINEWIRTKGNFDAFVDFDRVTRDPQNPSHLLAAYDSGDHLHPSPAGYAAMANAVPLKLFAQSKPSTGR